MKVSNNNKLIVIFPLISLYLCMPNMSSGAQCCQTRQCRNYNARSLSIEHPFRLKGEQPESCGCPGFDLYCDDEQGLLLELPNAGNFTVGYIFFYSAREIVISDPNDCLPQRIFDLDLTTTPFRGVSQGVDYQLYNCSADANYKDIYDDAIDCLSGSGYTIIGVSSYTKVTDPYCMFLKHVSIPAEYDFSNNIYLAWDENGCVSCVDQGPWKVLLGIFLPISVLLILICCICLWRRVPPRNQSATARITDTTTHTTTMSTPSSGLDQVTIDSYPMVNVGESNGVIKHDHGMCAICLSEYSSKDTLKILPHCLHRFHADCIDVWLQSKPTCPVCRTSPSQKLADFRV